MTDERNDNSDDRSTAAQRARRKAVRRAGPPPGDVPQPTVSVAKPVYVAKPVSVAKPAPAATPVPATKPVPKPVSAKLGVPEPVTAPSPEPKATRRRAWLEPVAAVVAAVLVLALAAGVAFLAYENDQFDDAEAQRLEYIQAARQTVLNLTTISPDTAKQDVDRLLESATGEFQAEFDGRIEPFVSIVREAKVSTNGEIIAAGLESESDDGAVVLVAAKSMVTNAGTEEPQPRNFRLRVSITDVDGRLATSKVEFVP